MCPNQYPSARRILRRFVVEMHDLRFPGAAPGYFQQHTGLDPVQSLTPGRPGVKVQHIRGIAHPFDAQDVAVSANEDIRGVGGERFGDPGDPSAPDFPRYVSYKCVRPPLRFATPLRYGNGRPARPYYPRRPVRARSLRVVPGCLLRPISPACRMRSTPLKYVGIAG